MGFFGVWQGNIFGQVVEKYWEYKKVIEKQKKMKRMFDILGRLGVSSFHRLRERTAGTTRETATAKFFDNLKP